MDIRSASVIGVLVLTLVGCRSGEDGFAVQPEKPSVSVNVNGKEISSSEFTITVPKDWKTFDIARSDFEQVLDSAAQQNPESAALFEQVRSAAKTGVYKLFSFGPSDKESQFAPNVNVVSMPVPENMKLDELGKGSAEQIKSLMKGTIAEQVTKEYPAGSAYRIKAYVNIRTSAGPTDLQVVSHLFILKKKQYVITYTFPKKHSGNFEAVAESSAQSFVAK